MTDKRKILKFPDTAAIETEAAAWVARFDAGDVSARDQAAFQGWLNHSALHRQIIAEYGELWSEFDLLQPLTTAGAGAQVPEQARGARSLKMARPWVAACAAAVAVALVAGGVVFRFDAQRHAKANHYSATLSYETPIGVARRIALTDGSTVVLSTNSRVDVRFLDNRRDVHLVRGEAFFDVSHDKARPFSVYANSYVVRDIGTAFHVHVSRTGAIEVAVTKGSVEVKTADGRQAFGAGKSDGVLVAGQNIVLGPDVEPLKAADTERDGALHHGQLIYTGQPLHKVLADLSRYSGIRIELDDPALENLQVGGAFRIDQIQVILTTLENNFGLRAQWINPRHVRFTSRRERPIAKD